MVEHRAQHFLIHCSHQKQHNAPGQQVRVLGSSIPSVRVLGEPPAAIDGAGCEGREKHQEVQVISEVHIFNEVISDLDNDLYCLEGYVGYPQKSHEVLIEYGTDLVND